jgi:hypothetical protein
MPHTSFQGPVLFTAALMIGALSSTACNRPAEETAPLAETQAASTVEGLNRPVTVQGCLRAGEGGTTFVLTSSHAEDGSTRTYALNYAAGTAPADLRDHIGNQVEVEGVVRSQDAVTARTPTTPAANDPVGTAGEPTVQTTTELAVQQLDVQALKPLGEACPDR